MVRAHPAAVAAALALSCAAAPVFREGFADGRNGTGWVHDVIEVARAAGVGVTYHALHEPGFGLYRDDERRPPADLNRPLAELLAREFLAAP